MRRLIDIKSKGVLLNVKPKALNFIDTKPVVGQFNKQTLDDIVTNLYPGMSLGQGWYIFVTYPKYVIVNP